MSISAVIYCAFVLFESPFFPRHGTASHDSYNEDMYRTLLESYQLLQQEMARVAAEWQECEKRIDDYVDEQVHTHLIQTVMIR